jgi:hypothetical protein
MQVAIHDGGNESAVHHAMNARLFDQPVGDQLEAFAVQLIAHTNGPGL